MEDGTTIKTTTVEILSKQENDNDVDEKEKKKKKMEHSVSPPHCQQPVIIIVRGPAGSGKSTVTDVLREELRKHWGGKAEGPAVTYLEQDYFRNVMLKHHPDARKISADMILQCVKAAMKNNSHVILEGILNMNHYAGMFQDILTHFPDRTFFYYLDVDIEETKNRHMGRAKSADFGCEKLDKWFSSAQKSGFESEVIVPASSSLSDTVGIMLDRFV